ncbi:MAG: hypothetical protein JW891_15555 [Candidatus Lokiarchaeota archaeon]|nr:hypothetical protein [Candidatus Lokiarchaeota archaeon]
MSYKDLYSEVKKRKMEALNKKNVVKAVEKHGRILAVEGRFEKPKHVVNNMYAAEKTIISPGKLVKYDLDLYDLVLIGCPGDQVSEKLHPRIKTYVENGGWLLSTDWCLVTIVEKIFPGYIRWNQQKTADSVVACQIDEPSHPFLDGVTQEIQRSKWSAKTSKDVQRNEFKWWLETKSYPVQIIDHQKVRVLISSRDIKYKWGEGAVLCYFDFGTKGGRVIHIISHTHLQKGGEKGKYASALILTNMLDDKISQKMGISQEPRVPIWNQPTQAFQGVPRESDDWLNPPSTQDNYFTPSTTEFPGNAELTGTSQIVELERSNFSLAISCSYCGFDFTSTTGKVYKCQECGALYHEECLNLQINEGVCKSCNRILLW